MNRLNEAIDRFCAKNPRFGIPNLMKYIIIGTALVGVLNMFTNYAASSYLAFNLAAVLRGEVFRLISFIFVPESSSPFFLFISLYFYYIIGNALESYWGHGRFTIYFCSGVLLTLLFTIVYSLISGVSYTLSGISYVTSSLFFAFAMLYGEARVLLFFFLPIKVKWFAFYEAVMFALEIVTCLSTGNYYYAFLPVVALLNFLVYFAPYFSRKAQQTRYQHSRQATEFRRASRQQQQKEQAQGFRHKCCVCGKTDTQYPDLAFRYCSKCAGYHCFCEEHIFNHVHFTEE